MAAIPPNNNLEGLIGSLKDGIYGAYNKGVKYGRYLALQEYLERKESAQPKWISVEERLPDKDGTYIILVPMSNGPFVDADQYTIGNGWYEWGNDSGITHWMPLPEPPREVK